MRIFLHGKGFRVSFKTTIPAHFGLFRLVLCRIRAPFEIHSDEQVFFCGRVL
jgi:hypothetical protein